jgi:inner membrane protein
MPTVFSHPVIPLALRVGLGADVIPGRLLLAGALCSVLPDLDVLAFWSGVPHESEFGHRGFSHSFAFATVVALVGGSFYRSLNTNFGRAFIFLLLATASHGVLDAFTDGGAGIAFFWPWLENRYFAPFRPIRVAPIGISVFFSHGSILVMVSELLWLWLPCLLTGAAVAACRRRMAIVEREAG